jgi:hypothetical protein
MSSSWNRNKVSSRTIVSQIDEAVYALVGLVQEEIIIAEESMIEFQYFEGCPNADQTLRNLK